MYVKFFHKKIKIDNQGYLINKLDWNEDLANNIAISEGLKLTKKHWQIIYLIRNFYLKYNISPTMIILIKYIKKNYGKKIANSRYLFRLFPKGPASQAAKIAGLPKPTICI